MGGEGYQSKAADESNSASIDTSDFPPIQNRKSCDSIAKKVDFMEVDEEKQP